MKKIILVTLAIAAVFVAYTTLPIAYALADERTPFAYNWSGFYAGGLATHGDGSAEHCAVGFQCPGEAARNRFDGWMGGATAGYNWQLTNWVVGVEGDWSRGSFDGRTRATRSSTASRLAAPKSLPSARSACARGTLSAVCFRT